MAQGEKAAIIKGLREEEYQLKHLVKEITIPKSTYYFEINKEDVVTIKNKKLLSEIITIFNENKGRYGVRHVHQELINRGYTVNHKPMQRLMHQASLSGKRPKAKYHSYKGEVGKVAENVVNVSAQ